jgi:hypothetical protein
MTEGSRFRADVEGLRAVAVLAVVAYHAGLGWVGGGFVGVDVFYVVSGFLITGLLGTSCATPAGSGSRPSTPGGLGASCRPRRWCWWSRWSRRRSGSRPFARGW